MKPKRLASALLVIMRYISSLEDASPSVLAECFKVSYWA